MLSDLTNWPARRWGAAVAGTVLAAALVGLPTALLPSSLFTRMTPVTWWSWPVWLVSSVLSGLVLATYVRTPEGSATGGVTVSGGGLLSALAVGCPICNKVVVAVLGVSGALQWWAPLQPVLGVASVGLLVWALRTRLRGERACRLPTSAEAPFPT